MAKKKEKYPELLQVRISTLQKNAIEEEKEERQYNSDSLVVRQLINERLTVRKLRKDAIKKVQQIIIDWDIKRHELNFRG